MDWTVHLREQDFLLTAIHTARNRSVYLQGKIVDQRLELELGVEEFEVAAAGGRNAHAPNIDGFKVWTALHQREQSRLRHVAATPKVDALQSPTRNNKVGAATHEEEEEPGPF